MSVRRSVSAQRVAAAGALAVMALGGCSPADDVLDVPTPVPTGAVDVSRALCGLDPASVDAVTGRAASTSEEDFVHSGAALRGSCEVHNDSGRSAVMRLTVQDASSDNCVAGREIVEGRGGWPKTARFETLDGGVWAQVEPSDEQRPLGPSTVAFVGKLCVSMDLSTMAPGRDPVREAEALTMQAIATLGLDGSPS